MYDNILLEKRTSADLCLGQWITATFVYMPGTMALRYTVGKACGWLPAGVWMQDVFPLTIKAHILAEQIHCISPVTLIYLYIFHHKK